MLLQEILRYDSLIYEFPATNGGYSKSLTNAQLIFVHWQLIIGCSFVCYIWKNKRFSTTSLAFAAFSRAAQAYDHLAAHQRLLQHLEIN